MSNAGSQSIVSEVMGLLKIHSSLARCKIESFMKVAQNAGASEAYFHGDINQGRSLKGLSLTDKGREVFSSSKNLDKEKDILNQQAQSSREGWLTTKELNGALGAERNSSGLVATFRSELWYIIGSEAYREYYDTEGSHIKSEPHRKLYHPELAELFKSCVGKSRPERTQIMLAWADSKGIKPPNKGLALSRSQ